MGDPRRVEELFHQAVTLPPDEQAAFLDQQCDAALRAEIEQLIRYDRQHRSSLTADASPVPCRENAVRESSPGRGDLPRSPRTSSSTSFDHGRFVPGTVVSERYRIVGLLGKGGMGEVYRADDLELGQSVALKFLPEHLAADQRSLERFRNEVRLARQVSHPNVCRVYDIGQIDGNWFLSMEYVDGEDLALLLRRIGRFPKDRAIEIARQLCLGLEAAHEKGVLHRDLKPANVMVDGRGKVRITDFGLADLAEDVDGEDVRSGTPAYMAPEQLVGREVTRQSDIYSLGLVLHEVFTGKPVWEADTLAELFQKRKESTVRSPSSHLVDDLDPAIERVIGRCLEADAKNRPVSAIAVAAALPGGDPLAAARAAGETPSPEIVAAAGGSTRLSPVVGGALLAVIVGSVAALWLNPFLSKPDSALPVQPEFLARDAQEILETLGHRDAENPPKGVAYGFRRDPRAPRGIGFWYRESPLGLSPQRRGFGEDLSSAGRVTVDDPPFTVPGMVTLTLDARGRLYELKALTLSEDGLSEESEAIPGAEIDQDKLFGWAGLSATRFKELSGAHWSPPVFADRLWSWESLDSSSSSPPRVVRAATHDRKLVYFEDLFPTGSESRRPQQRVARYRTMTGTVGLFFLFLAAPLARRNVIRGRSDRRGAFRLGVFFFLSSLFVWIVGSTHVPDPAVEVRFFGFSLMSSVFKGFSTWMMYLAIEPYVRRIWPETLITSTRLLTGRVRDPSVARDVLIGGACCAVWLSMTLGMFVAAGSLPRGVPPDLALGTFLGGRFLAAEIVHIVVRGIDDAVFFLLMLFVLRVLVRRGWLAVVVFAAIWTLLWAPSRPDDFPGWFIAPVVFGSIAFVLTRYGLVACIASLVFLYLQITLPRTTDATSWYWDTSLYGLLAVLLLTGYGFWVSLAREPFPGGNGAARVDPR